MPGKLFVTDTYNQAIRMITPAGMVTTLAGTVGSLGSADGNRRGSQSVDWSSGALEALTMPSRNRPWVRRRGTQKIE
jgi:hypothetical protein